MCCSMSAKVRLFVEHPLGAAQPVPLTRDQGHYLFGVMRLAVGDKVALFNGSDGEWQAEVAEAISDSSDKSQSFVTPEVAALQR